mgnify:CR=1 FL=1
MKPTGILGKNIQEKCEVADMEKKKLNKTTKSNLITYGMVLAAYLIVQGMIAGNLLSNLMQGLLVPLCVYIILALFP